MPSSIMDQFDSRSLAPSVQSTYTVQKNPVEMTKTNTTVHDILKYNLLNSRRKTKILYRQSFDETYNGGSILEQRSRIDTISKSFGTLRGLPRKQIRASIDSTNLSMDATLREINGTTTLRRTRFSSQIATNNTTTNSQSNHNTPAQQISFSTLNTKIATETARKKSIQKMLNEMDKVFKDFDSSSEPNNIQEGKPADVPQNQQSKTISSTLTSTAQQGVPELDITTTAVTSSSEVKAKQQQAPNDTENV